MTILCLYVYERIYKYICSSKFVVNMNKLCNTYIRLFIIIGKYKLVNSVAFNVIQIIVYSDDLIIRSLGIIQYKICITFYYIVLTYQTV